MKTQKGTLCKIGGHWFARWWETRNERGELVRKRVSHKGPVITTRGKHPPADVRKWHTDFMAARASSTIPDHNVVTMKVFVESVFLPQIEKHQRPSTASRYRSIWELHLKARVGDTWLRDIRTFHIQTWLNAIVEDSGGLSRNSCKRIQSCLSGMFKLAKQLCFYEGINPIQDTKIDPRAAEPAETVAYTLEQEQAFIDLLPEPASTAFAVAAYAGLRLGELEGLEWSDLKDGELHVSRSIWNGHVVPPKTRKSAAAVPIIKALREKLEIHRARAGNPQTGPIFANSLGRPMSLNNLLHRFILPVLNRCGLCGNAKGLPHLKAHVDHDWQRDPRLPEWKGWHAARRGLGTNLYRLGVPPLVIQRILRHSNVSTTTSYYILPIGDDVTKGMATFENAIQNGLSRQLSDSEAMVFPDPESIN